MPDGIDLRIADNLYIGSTQAIAAYFNNEKIWPQKEYVLPEGYTALDYIENIADGGVSSANYLNTGIDAANDIEIYIEYEDNFYYTTTACSNYIVGARNGSSGTILMGIGGSTGSNTYNVNCNGSSAQPISNYSRTRGKKYTVDLKYSSTGLNYSVTVDEGTPYTGTLAGNITTAGVPIYIFAWNSSNIKSNTRVYKCIIKKSGQIVRYYLPCISPGNVVGLYDCANSAGTGFNSGVSTSYKFYGPGIASYLTFTSQANSNNFYYRASSVATTGSAYTVYYSVNGGLSWANPVSANSAATSFITLSSGDTIMIRAKNPRYSSGNTAYNRFYASGNYKVEGNIMSLISSGNFMTSRTLSTAYTFHRLFLSSTTLTDSSELYLPATTLSNYCYQYMFYGCTNMTGATKMLPATALNAYCYRYMYRGCSKITSAPEFPNSSTTMSSGSYGYMFYGCSALTTPPPVLPSASIGASGYSYMFAYCSALTSTPEILATSVGNSGCSYMFRDCKNIEKSPTLLPQTLNNYSYQYMFYGCTKLNYIKCLATSVSASNCKTNWVNGVASSGTFVKSSSISTSTWGSGVSGIPTNWSVNDAT